MIEIIDEKFIENSIKPISIEGIEKILFQMKNCICKIYGNDGIKGTGFFCKIPFPNESNLLPVLITNNHVLRDKDVENKSVIRISLNNEKEEKIIKIKTKKRIIFTCSNPDITFIEISPHKYTTFSENSSIYIIN